ncbi:MAG: hypothetical protein ABSB41_02315 [Anaerolineales bacterium]|jgi:hypothetical protein
MDVNLIKQLAEQLNSVVETYKELGSKSKYDDLSDLGEEAALNLITRSTAAIERVSGRESVYSRQIQEILSRKTHDFDKLSMVIGVVESLTIDIQSGYLSSASELIHGEIFGDFLEMSEHLSEEGYKDAAAVIAGSALEAQLRQLCIKNNIPIEVITAKGIQPMKADLMNSDLGHANTISKLDQKNVTAWLDLRNKAAHGKYSEYTKDQVTLMIGGIRDFVTRNNA